MLIRRPWADDGSGNLTNLENLPSQQAAGLKRVITHNVVHGHQATVHGYGLHTGQVVPGADA